MKKCECCGLVGCEKDNELKESTLSSKRKLKPYGMSMIYEEEDVKNFIKELKEEITRKGKEGYITKGAIYYFKEKIDKLAGKDLI